MAQLWPWILFVVPWHIGTAAADDGDDFANNLFTDLAPLLSLFGERVTMQFMSQALGFSDCVLVAVAPLGIVTLIVSAIRVGGPTWLKAIIGRARENLSAAELELMSSTSEEVCELWNGANIIRCQGSADIWQFICLLQPTPYGSALDSGSNVDFRTLDQVTDVNGDGGGLMRRTTTSGPAYAFRMVQSRLYQLFRSRSRFNLPGQISSDCSDEEVTYPNRHGPRTVKSTGQTAVQTRKLDRITIIRDGGSDSSAPNLALNCHDRVGRGEMYLMALGGGLLQMGVLVFSGFITYYRPVLSLFEKGGEPVDGYAFPCAAVGTGILVLGMFLCAVVVEHSTVESSFEAVEQGTELQVVWLQKNHVTNDQVFQPFAIYPNGRRQFIMTSRRRFRSGRQGSDGSWPGKDGPPRALELLTVVATVVALVGFCVQFVGLRGLNWAASVAQLGAVILMTVTRAWVRRGLSQPPISERVTPNFELDWFALSLADPATAPWRRASGTRSSNPQRNDRREVADRTANDWSVRSGRQKDYTQFAKLEEVVVSEGGRRMSTSHGNAQRVLEFRIQLGDLAVWRGPASEEAISLTAALEIVAKALLPRNGMSSFTWTLPVELGRGEGQEADDGVISIRVTGSSGRWRIEAGEIEAVMSLWMHSVHSRDSKSPKVDGSRLKKGGDRLRSLVGQEPGLRLYGSCARRKQIERDLHLWMPQTTTGFLSIQSLPQYIQRHHISEKRVVGFTAAVTSDEPTATATATATTTLDDEDDTYEVECPDCKRNHDNDVEDDLFKGDELLDVHSTVEVSGHAGTLALPCDEPLEKLFSRDLMFSFVMAVAQLRDFSVPKAAARDHINYGDVDNERHKPKLHHATLTNLVRNLENSGYGDSPSLYFDLIVPLSIQRKLTDASHLISSAQEVAKEYEQKRSWRKLTDVCIWLLRLSRKLDADRDRSQALGVVTCLDCLRKMHNAEILYSFEDVAGYEELSRSKQRLVSEFRRKKLDNALHFFRLSKARRDEWAIMDEDDEDLLQMALQISSTNADELEAEAFPESFGLTQTHQVAMTDVGKRLPYSFGILDEDSFGWTPAHYALAHGVFTEEKIRWLKLHDGHPSLTRVDFRGWTLLHYACHFRNLALVKYLLALQQGGALTAPGHDGITPLHCAVGNPGAPMIEAWTWGRQSRDFFVCESKGGPRLRDINGRALIHWAAMRDSVAWAEVAKHDLHLKDDFGLTALHIAAMYGSKELLELLLKEDASGKDELSGDGFSSYRLSPLHLAVSKGNNGAASALIDAGVDVNATNTEGETPLYIAVSGKNKDGVQMLLASGASLPIFPRDRIWSPLHLALFDGNLEMIKVLADADRRAPDKAVLLRNLHGDTPLHILARDSPPATAVRILEELLTISPDIDVNVQNNGGQTPLECAYQHRNCPELIQELEKRGAKVLPPDDSASKSSLSQLFAANERHMPRRGPRKFRSEERLIYAMNSNREIGARRYYYKTNKL